MKGGLNNRGDFPAFLLFSIGLTYLFLFGTSPVWATDIEITKTADKSKYQVGDTITFTLTIDNTSTTGGGPYDSPGTIVMDDLPSGLEFQSAEASNGADVTYNAQTRQVRSDMGTVDAYSTEAVTVVTTATQAGYYTNRAYVEGDLYDPDPGNNGDSFSYEVTEPEPPSIANKADGNLSFSGEGGDPVNTFTGGRFNSYPADLNLRGPMPLFFSRYYDSFIKSDGNITSSLGDNWLGNFDMTLTQNGSAVEVITNRGRLIQFEQDGASWNLTGKTDIAYQLVQSGTDFILGDPYTGRMYTFARDLPNSGPDPLIIDDFLNPIPRIEALSQDGTFPVSTGTTVEGSMLGGEFDVLLVLDAVENPADGAYFTAEQGRAIFSQDTTSTGRVLLVWDGVDGDAVRVVASTGLGGGVDLTQDGTVDGIEIEVARNDQPLKVALIVYTGVEKTSELTLDIPVTDSLIIFRYPFSDLTSLGESADLTRVTTVIVLVGAQGSANGPVHIEINSIKMTPSAINGTPSDTIRKLTMIEDGKGNVHTLTYSGDTLSFVSDGLGRTLNFTYTGDQLSSVDDGTRTITFNHTGNDLTGYTDSIGNATAYNYAAGGLMTATTRPAGNTPYSQTYDGNGRVATQTDANGNTFTFAYAPPDTTLTDPLGNTRVHTHTATGEFSSRTDQAGLSFTMGSDANGRRNSLTDRLGDTSILDYHAPSGNLAAVTNADGTTTTYDYTARTHSKGIVFYDLTGATYPDGTTESSVYDSSGNMVSRTDQAGNVWSFTYNDNGQVLTATNPAGGVATHTYNADGTLTSRTDADGNRTTFGYDGLKRPNLITVADGTTVSFTYDHHDQLLTSTDGNGNITTLTYNANGNLTSNTDPLGSTTTFDYDGNDRLLSVTDTLGNTTTVTYNQLGKIDTLTDGNGNVTTMGYNILGRLISINDASGQLWSITHDAEAILASTTDPLGNTTRFTSDTMGRFTSTTSPLSNVTSITYDTMGRITAVQNPLGQITTRSYDVRGLTSDITLPDGAAAFYARDDLGRITGITDPAGNNWQRAYDSQGRLTSTADPLGNLTTYQYDNRNRVSIVNLPASTLDLSYDGVGNITRRLYSDGTDLNYTSDAMNRLTGAEGITLGYDANGRITVSNGLIITRDVGGRIATVTIASGKTITYTYDSRNRLTQVADWLGGTTTFAYDDAGRLTSIAHPNGVTTTYTYDNDSRLTGIAEGVISNIALTRDGRGQITTAARNLPLSASQLSTYTYDSAGRLTNDGTRSYTWDLASRMTSRTEGADTVTFTYDAASQLSTYTYDSMGRLTNDGTRTYTWDLASRMNSYTEGGAAVTFTYDALGYRTSRTEGGTTHSYLWNYALGLPSISVLKEAGINLRYFIHTPGGTLLYSIEAEDNSRRFYQYDEMGNTLFLTDDSGSVISSYAYSPYGELLSTTGSLDNPFTWQGKFGVMQEGSNGLYYMRARYYDSQTERFISRDPLKRWGPANINPYQYAMGNPMRFIDPSGLCSDTARVKPPTGNPTNMRDVITGSAFAVFDLFGEDIGMSARFADFAIYSQTQYIRGQIEGPNGHQFVRDAVTESAFAVFDLFGEDIGMAARFADFAIYSQTQYVRGQIEGPNGHQFVRDAVTESAFAVFDLFGEDIGMSARFADFAIYSQTQYIRGQIEQWLKE